MLADAIEDVLKGWWSSVCAAGRDVVVNGIIGSRAVPHVLRARSLRFTEFDIGRCSIESGVIILRAGILRVGSGSYINTACMLDLSAPIEMGRNVFLGHGVRLITSTHHLCSTQQRAVEHQALPIVIESGAWIGASATILPDVRIACGAVVQVCWPGKEKFASGLAIEILFRGEDRWCIVVIFDLFDSSPIF